MAKLSEHIAPYYHLRGIVPGEVIWRGARYDFRSITKAQADSLYQAGYPRLVKRKQPKKSSGKEE